MNVKYVVNRPQRPFIYTKIRLS